MQITEIPPEGKKLSAEEYNALPENEQKAYDEANAARERAEQEGSALPSSALPVCRCR
jgi:hypothetical protein